MASNKIPEYRSTTLVQHLADSINKKSEIKYCFILGAGASRSSGISTGYELAKKWFEDIKRIFPDYQLWVDENNIDEKNIAKHYGKIYKKRFEINPIEGYEFMQTEMANSSPSFGYSILSQLLETQHNVVITTNFDALVEDALFLYSKYKPLVCGHESLSEFVKPVNSRPVIIKVHRDLLLHPKNEDGELLKLEEGFANSLDRIFQGFTPIVIGYAGNDLSLMNYMNGCNSIKNIFWCRRTGDVLSNEINILLENKNGKVFEIAGFDELMFQIYAELYKEKELDQLVKKQADKKAREWSTQLIELSKGFKDKESQESLTKITKDKKYDDWYDVVLAANAESDLDLKKKIYLDGLNEFSESAELNGEFAMFLSVNDQEPLIAEKYYIKSLSINPNYSITVGNYASFLHFKKKDYELAEKYYLKSLELDDKESVWYSNYANFLRDIKKKFVESERYYLKAIELGPKNITAIGNYANFLLTIKKDFNKATIYFNRSIELEPNNSNNLANYVQFLIATDEKNIAKEHIYNLILKKNLELSLQLELWFYCFANFYLEYPKAKDEIDKLINTGARSEGWDLSINIEKAKEQNHPEIDKVIEYAEKISGLKYN